MLEKLGQTITLPSWHQNKSFDRLLLSLALLTVLFFKLGLKYVDGSTFLSVSLAQISSTRRKKSLIYEYNYVTSKPSNYRTTSKCI